MKEKIIARIKAKFPAVNLSKKRLDEISDKLAAKITDENEIDAQLDDYNEIRPLAEIAQTDDKIRDLSNKVKNVTKPTETNDQSSSQQTDTTGTPDDTPAWAKSLVESNQKLAQKLEAFEKEKAISSMQSKLAAHEKLKGISPVFYKGRALPEKEEDLDTFVEGIVTDFNTFKQEAANTGLTNSGAPASASSATTNKVSSLMQLVQNDKNKTADKTAAK
ncbi:MAG TPA: hypothetical protein VEZ55_06920 [Chitinophagaceae bacterium]|nr:hypothetical protein [Chitinophagaceae bacterium]